jgi:probable rRNA maturation factor
LVRRVVTGVLDGERAGPSVVSITFVSPARMRALHARAFGRARLTDVVAFQLPHPALLAGDVYVCPTVARRAAGTLGIPAREELVRLVVHGTLHVLGYRHPDGNRRTTSAMWKRQERHVRAATGRRA